MNPILYCYNVIAQCVPVIADFLVITFCRFPSSCVDVINLSSSFSVILYNCAVAVTDAPTIQAFQNDSLVR